MAITVRILGSLAISLAAGLVPASADAQEPMATSTISEVARVRSGSAKLSALITEATQRSPTFRALIASIEATDGVVLLEEGKCRHGVPACLTWNVTLAWPYRMLFVLLDPRKPDLDLMASMGHELQHAREVLDNPSMRTREAIQLFYMRGMSPENPRTVETLAAEAAGNAVYREIRRSRYSITLIRNSASRLHNWTRTQLLALQPSAAEAIALFEGAQAYGTLWGMHYFGAGVPPD